MRYSILKKKKIFSAILSSQFIYLFLLLLLNLFVYIYLDSSYIDPRKLIFLVEVAVVKKSVLPMPPANNANINTVSAVENNDNNTSNKIT